MVKTFIKTFISIFIIAFSSGAVITYLWNLIFKGLNAVDWDTSTQLALILAIVISTLHTRKTSGN